MQYLYMYDEHIAINSLFILLNFCVSNNIYQTVLKVIYSVYILTVLSNAYYMYMYCVVM